MSDGELFLEADRRIASLMGRGDLRPRLLPRSDWILRLFIRPAMGGTRLTTVIFHAVGQQVAKVRVIVAPEPRSIWEWNLMKAHISGERERADLQPLSWSEGLDSSRGRALKGLIEQWEPSRLESCIGGGTDVYTIKISWLKPCEHKNEV